MEAEAEVIKWYINKLNSMLTFYPPLEVRRAMSNYAKIRNLSIDAWAAGDRA